MHVFNLPSYPYVIKVIKDEFGHSKQSDRETVKRKFLMVKEIDRVGRMADTLEFKNLALPRSRFAPELLEQLLELAPSTVETDGENVIVGHCYVERRMTPLNLYLETATPDEVEDVVREYGDTIRDLAIANVFAGDMLWRNFGVNRHGRVVFYDYDEIEYLTDCVVPRHPAGRRTPRPSCRASPGTRSARSTSSRRSSRPSCSATRRCARRSCATTPTCCGPSSGSAASSRWRAARSSTSSRTRSRCGSAGGMGSRFERAVHCCVRSPKRFCDSMTVAESGWGEASASPVLHQRVTTDSHRREPPDMRVRLEPHTGGSPRQERNTFSTAAPAAPAPIVPVTNANA